MFAVQAFVVALFVCIHLFAGYLRFLGGIPRSRWLSGAGGVSVAYVFIHILPELGAAQVVFEEATVAIGWLEHHAYLVALAGLVVFYGLERLVKKGRSAQGHADKKPGGKGTFAIHITSFALYNLIIGYLLVHREDPDARGLILFAIAIGLHLLVNDYGFRQDHQHSYHAHGRWILAAGIVAGWLLGLALQVPESVVNLLFAFLAGGIILNVLKEELPEERKSRLVPFIGGSAAYAVLLVATAG